MITLEQEPDSELSDNDLALELTEKMQSSGTSNDLDHSSPVRGDEVNMLGNGVPGYETTGVPESEDEDALQMTTPVPRPKDY